MWRTAALALVIYLSLDVTDPHMPGALNFEVDKSVEVVHGQARAKLSPADIPAPPLEPVANAAPSRRTTQVRRLLPVARTLPSHLRPRAVLSAHAPSAPDDH